jgi:hypothetical protein
MPAIRGCVLLVVAVLTAACQRSEAPVPQVTDPAPAYKPDATVKDLMLSIIDPSADVVWLSVKYEANKAGAVDYAPKTDEEWATVRHGAIALAEAANMLMIPGRHVARPGEPSEVPGIELEPAEMEKMIVADRTTWNARATALHDATMDVLQAIDAHDPVMVFELGAAIDEACENCHTHYWYPNEKVPEFPRKP